MNADTLIENYEFITDLCRYSEGSMTEKQVRRKHRDVTDADWKRLGEDDVLVAAIELEKAKRIRSGANPREKAQLLFAGAPDVLGGIMNDKDASPRHRIESAKELRAISANGPETAPAGERFVITLNLGGDSIHFDKPRAVGVDDSAGRIDVTIPATITAAEPKDGDNGPLPTA
jgi:hypothetical protein